MERHALLDVRRCGRYHITRDLDHHHPYSPARMLQGDDDGRTSGTSGVSDDVRTGVLEVDMEEEILSSIVTTFFAQGVKVVVD